MSVAVLIHQSSPLGASPYPCIVLAFACLSERTCNVNKWNDVGIENWTPSTAGRIVCELQVQGSFYLATRLRGGRLIVLITFRPGIQPSSIPPFLLSR